MCTARRSAARLSQTDRSRTHAGTDGAALHGGGEKAIKLNANIILRFAYI